MWLLYNILFPAVFLLMTPRFLLRMWKRGGYGHGFLQRFGVYGDELSDRLKSQRRIWMHAVSVGEILVAIRFMQELRARQPGVAFVLTTTTSTGHAIAAKKLSPDDVLLYFPVDLPFIVARVLDRLDPVALIIVECELWPNLIRHAKRRGMPIMLLNGRISERSYRAYAKIRPLVSSVLQCFDLLCAQDLDIAERLKKLGADPSRVRIVGSAKYDLADPGKAGRESEARMLLDLALGAGTKILVGGSTWPGEEAILLDIYKTLRKRHGDMRLVLAPRHAERAKAVLSEIEAAGLTAARRSRIGARNAGDYPADVLLVDTTGELGMFYAEATVIFVGKSLTANGGQNIIEPAILGKTVIVGPHMENFASVASDFLAAQAVIQVKDARQLEEKVDLLWTDETMRAEYGNRARNVVVEKSGAIRKSAEEFLSLLEDRT